MKSFGLTLILFLLAQQASIAQDADTVHSFKIRKPVEPDTIKSVFFIDTVSVVQPTFAATRTFKGLPQPPMLPRPVEAKVLGVSGVVYVSYEWNDSERKSANAKVERGVHPLLDEVALDYIKKAQWNPVVVDYDVGTFENGRYTVPIIFAMD